MKYTGAHENDFTARGYADPVARAGEPLGLLHAQLPREIQGLAQNAQVGPAFWLTNP
jgi:hypothetical protein